MGRWWGI